jgi:hypothetical protein
MLKTDLIIERNGNCGGRAETEIAIFSHRRSVRLLRLKRLISPLAIGSSCALNVRYQPTSVGNANAAITFTSNDAGSPHSVPLSGVSAKPDNLTPILMLLLD